MVSLSRKARAGDRGSFWVGGEPVQGPLGTVLRGPMYVEWDAPAEPSAVPWVLVHGGGGQGTDYLVTPDGRPGWARLLVDQGHTVYVVDRPGHGRSPHHPEILGPMGPPIGAEFLGSVFLTPSEDLPDGVSHTQWPGGEQLGDPVFDQFVSAPGPMLADPAAMHELEQRRLSELLDLIGPAVVLTHSAGGPGAWLAADGRPEHVAAFVAVETLGPPFAKLPDLHLDLAWGLASAPLTFDPPAAEASDLDLVVADPSESGPPLTLQAEPPRRLPNLSRFPIAVVTAPASPFAAFDRHLVAFLEQGGCEVDLLRLADKGVHGNGHGMMMEKNHAEVLEVITGWASSRVGPTSTMADERNLLT